MMLLLIVFTVLSYTPLLTKANGCTPFIPSSLVRKTGVIPSIEANFGGNNNNYRYNSTIQNYMVMCLFLSVLRSQVGGHFVSPWSLFSATQIQQNGLWCQVDNTSNAGMGSNIGDMFYPTGDGPDGFTVVPTSDTNNTVPYQQLICTNQIGLVVDGNVTNNQGIVKCSTTILNLDRIDNYWVVYSDSLFNSYHKSSFSVNLSEYFQLLYYSWSHSGLHHDTHYTLIKRC